MEKVLHSKRKWKKYCSVVGCGEYMRDTFAFPQNIALRLKWKAVCKIQKGVSETMVVCERHFPPSEILLCADGKKRVKKDAVPSLLLPDGRVVRKSRRNCFVPDCSFGLLEGVTLHHSPRSKDQILKWATALKLDTEAVNESRFICSRHFKDIDFRTNSGKKRLSRTAIPSLNLPGSKLCCSRCNALSRNLSQKWKILCDCSDKISSTLKGSDDMPEPFCDSSVNYGKLLSDSSVSDDMQCSDSSGSPSDSCALDHNLSLEEVDTLPLDVVLKETKDAMLLNMTPVQECEVEKLWRDFAAGSSVAIAQLDNSCEALVHLFRQISLSDSATQTDVPKCTLIDLLQTDLQCKSFLGVTSKFLHGISMLCQQLRPVSHNSTTTMKERVAMVLCKLYLNLSLECIGALFGVDRKVCSTYFSPTLHLLACILDKAIFWPSKEHNMKNMPKCFKKFKNTRVVLDCSELPVDSPKCLKCHIHMYSCFKSRLTVKFMVGVAPSGMLTFRSKCYGGKASNVKIFNECDLITKGLLEPLSDAVMVDKGFKIDKVCESKFIKIHRLPFINRQQLGVDNENYKATIINARVHVERAIQRMKTFKVLSDKLSWFIVPDIDNIITVIMALVNLNSPSFVRECFLTKINCEH